MKYVLNFLLCSFLGVSLLAQPTDFSFVESNLSALFLGKATIDQNIAQSGDWIGAFDVDGNCVGANPIILTDGNAYFSLTIYGDDPATPTVDEGMEDGETFTIRLWDSGLMNMIDFPDNDNPTMFTGWSDTQGGPIGDYNDPDDIYNFINLLNLGCPVLLNPNDGSMNIQTSVLINWFDVDNADGYKLSIGDQSGVYNVVDQLDLEASSSYLVDNLECGTTYFVKIYPYNNVGLQTYCIENQFSTLFATANAGEDVQLCEGESVQLSATGGAVYKWSPSEGLSDTLIKSPIASPSVSTSYSVTVTHNNGCQDIDTVDVIVLSSPDVNLTVSHETSEGANNGAAFSVPTGGLSPYTYLWSNGSTDSSIENLIPATYSVTVSDIEGCLDIVNFEILAYDCSVLNVFSNITAVSCHNDCDGGINVTNVTNGIPPYSYIWNIGDTTNSIQGVCSGLYQVTITDSINCTSIRNYIVNNPDILIANIATTNETDTSANDGLAFSSPIGGTSPFYYLWNNGETTQLIDSLTPGHYMITVTDNKGCQDTEVTTINQFGCDNVSISLTLNNVGCSGVCDGKLEVDDVFGGVGPFTYNWSSGSVNRIINDLCVGTYFLTVTDAEDCHVFGQYTIEEPTELFVNLQTINEMSLNGENGYASVSPSGGTAPYFYMWGNGSTEDFVDDFAPGEYSVTVIDSKNCTKADSFSIEEFSCPIYEVNKVIDLITCNSACDGIIDFNPTGGTMPYNYFWNDGSTEREHENLCPGLFIVTITDSAGCQVVDSTYLTEDEIFEVSISSQNESTQNSHDGSISPTVSGGLAPYYYLWSDGDSTPVLINLIPGSYGLTLTDSRGCQFVDNNIVIEAFQCLDMSIDYIIEDLSCYNECTGVISITNISDGTFPFTYNWSSGDMSNSITNSCAGVYQLTLTDANDCVLTQVFEIKQPPAYYISLNVGNETSTGSQNGFANAFIVGGTTPYDVLWNTGSTDVDLENLGAGIYIVTVTDANDCVLIDTAEVLAVNCELLSLSTSTQNNTCYGANDAFINILVENANEPYEIEWSNGSTATLLTSLAPDIYSVSILDDLGCTYTQSFVITSPDEINIVIDGIQHSTDSTLLGGINISVSGGTSPYEYLWTSEGYTADTADIFDLEVGCYHLEVMDALGCVKDLDACIADLTTAVDDISLDQKIIVFPNPTNGILNISIDKDVIDHYFGKIMDISGKILLDFDSKTLETPVNLSDLDDGLYFLELKFEERKIYRKIYIQK